jgi:hypothetical protein
MVLFIFALITISSTLSGTEYFHYYSFAKNNESLQSLVEREFIISKKKEVNYAFYLKIMKENSRLKDFDRLPKDERIYFRLPKVILKDEDKAKVSLELSKAPKFSVDDFVSEQEAYQLETKLAEYLNKKKIKKREEAKIIAEKMKEKDQLIKGRSPASKLAKEEQVKSIEDLLREEEEFIMQNDIKTN